MSALPTPAQPDPLRPEPEFGFDAADFERVRKLIHQRAGISLHAGKQAVPPARQDGLRAHLNRFANRRHGLRSTLSHRALAPGAAQEPPAQAGEACFFWHEAEFNNDAVKMLPGEYSVYNEDLLIMTTLCSCIAACLRDRQARIGGMNHSCCPKTTARGRAAAAAAVGSRWSCSSTR